MRTRTLAACALAFAFAVSTTRAAEPCDADRLRRDIVAFRRAHPQPPPFVKEAWVEYNKALYSASRDWITTCPDEAAGWAARFSALQQMDDAPKDDVATTVNSHLRLSGEREEWAYFEAASIYLRHGIATPDVEQWIAAGERGSSDPAAGEWRAWALRARARLLRGALEEADGAVAKLGNLVADGRDKPAANAAARREKEARAAEYWQLRGQLAAKRGLPADAFAFYRRALQHAPGDDALKADAANAWKTAGGSRQGLAAFEEGAAGSPPPGVASWETRDDPLPAFDLVDLEGRRWSSQELRGTVLLLNMWATWCGPCKIELPYVEKLHRRLAGRRDVRVVTLNADAKAEYPRAFAADQKLTFPTLLALDYVREITGGEILLPQSWIVDGEGRVRLSSAGFSTNRGDAWVQETLDSLLSFVGDGAGHRSVSP